MASGRHTCSRPERYALDAVTRTPEGMKALPWIIAAFAVCVALYYSGETIRLSDEDIEQARELDSLRNVAVDARTEAEGWKMYADSVKAHTDSVAASWEPDTVIVTRWLYYTKYAPLELVRDSLMTP